MIFIGRCRVAIEILLLEDKQHMSLLKVEELKKRLI